MNFAEADPTMRDWALERAIKTFAHWQQRARHAEAILQELAEQQRRPEDHPWWVNRV